MNIPANSLIPFFIIFFITTIITYPLTVIIHESGHLILELLSAYKFISFSINNKIIIKQNNSFQIKTYSLLETAGQCLLKPPPYNQHFPYFLYNIGGGLFNLIFAFISFGLCIIFKDNFVIKITLSTFALINLFTGCLNLLPLKLDVPNDGYNILMMFKEKDSRFGFYSQMTIYDLMINGIKLQDMDETLFQLPDNCNLNNPLNQSIVINKIARLHEQLKFNKAKILIDQLNQQCTLFSLFKNELDCEYLFYLIMENLRNPEIKKLYQKLEKYIKMTIKTSLERQRQLYAYELLVNDNPIQANHYLDKFNILSKNYPIDVTIESEKEIFNLILKQSKN